jgi:GNAT superfamily N-acetyltransferase
MSHFITRFPLVRFKELIPLLLRCFPDFWEARLAENKYSFPYDLKLFAACTEGKMAGCIGIHGYPFLLGDTPIPCGGVSDVAVAPEFRGRGYASQLQEYVLAFCRRRYKRCVFIPLYTDKPGVYTRLGWQVYHSDRSTEIQTADFPPKNTFTFDANRLSLPCLRGSRAPRTAEEKKAWQIINIYTGGKNFDGKCCRSGKTWWELFADRSHRWRLENDTCYLYKEESLLEAYSLDPYHPVSRFTPRHGGHDDNKVMINFPGIKSETEKQLATAIEKRSFVFPAADVF